MTRYFGHLLLALLLISWARPVQATECGDCVERKAKTCSEECKLVDVSRIRDCQNDCVKEYCKHRCQGGEPELSSFLAKDCEQCLDQQFNLCETKCVVGTDRIRAECKLGCSKANCSAVCAQTKSTSEEVQGEEPQGEVEDEDGEAAGPENDEEAAPDEQPKAKR